MPDITATKETLWRQSSDEYGTVHVQKVTRLTDDEGEATERIWRRAITPDDDITDLPNRLQIIVRAARYPEAVARWEAQKSEGTTP